MRIVRTHGQPLGDRDPLRDATSPLLRSSERWSLLFWVGLISLSIGGLVFAVYWYPMPDPFDRDLIVSGRASDPADYILAPLVLDLLLLALGTYWAVVWLYWHRIVRAAKRSDSVGRRIDGSRKD